MSRTVLYWMIGLSFVGVILSAYSLAHKTGFTSGALCNINNTFSCDIVNQGPYSEIYGIPVALIGLIGYGFMVIATVVKQKNIEDKTLTVFLLVASLSGFIFSLYLTSLEAFVLHAWCVVCLFSQVTITTLVVLSLLLIRSEKNIV